MHQKAKRIVQKKYVRFIITLFILILNFQPVFERFIKTLYSAPVTNTTEMNISNILLVKTTIKEKAAEG
jgi:hypothetical protein